MARHQSRCRRPQVNEKELPIDVVSEVLKHSDIATTRRHYAPTKSERARAALVGMRLT